MIRSDLVVDGLPVRVETRVFEPDFMLELCTRVSAASVTPLKLDLLAQRPGLFAGRCHLPAAAATFRFRPGGRLRIEVECSDERKARELLSEEVQRAFGPLPSGSMLRYQDGLTRLLMPGGSRGDREVGAAVAVTRLACRHIVIDSGYR